MKKIEKLRLKDIVNDSLDTKKLSKILPESMKMLMGGGYGCKSDVCSQNWSGHPCAKDSEICELYTCTSGVAG